MKRLTLATLALISLAGCVKEESSQKDSSAEVTFSTESTLTRLNEAGTSWKTGDFVGISMDGGTTYRKYESTTDCATTTFTAAEGTDSFVYPQTGSVDFCAYYPYTNDSNYYTDLSDQSAGIGEHDFMVATKKNCSEGDVVTFDFNHALAKIHIDVECNGEVTSLDGLEVTIAEMDLKAVYTFTGQISSSGSSPDTMTLYTTFDDETKTSATVEAIINLEAVDNTITFALGDKNYTETITIASPEAGNAYNYFCKIGNEKVTFDSTIPEIGDWESKDSQALEGLN